MRKTLTTVAELVGMASMTAGAGFIYWPAALIVGGICLFVIGLAQG